jgi:hypothetical protein
MVTLTLLTSCAYNKAFDNLPPEEQTAFRAYRKMMTSRQEHVYLSKPTPAERSAYLRDIGIQQRFDALDEPDRESIRNGFIRKGMSADALRFLWGEPEDIYGATGQWEYWLYRGFASDLFEAGNRSQEGSSQVRVYLVDSHVEWWTQEVPESTDDPGDIDRNLR